MKNFVFVKTALLLVAAFFIGISSYVFGWNNGYDSVPNILSDEKLFTLVNNWKASQGSKPYIEDSKLCKLAATRLIEIESDWSHRQFWNHTQDFPNSDVGENLARGSRSEEENLSEWLKSPKHKENLEANFTHSCIKCDMSNNENYCVQVFANF